VIVDENGDEVADQLINPIHELEAPEKERYAVVLKRHDGIDQLPPASFLVRSGEPASGAVTAIGTSSGHTLVRGHAERRREHRARPRPRSTPEV
jgi:hypothetical protein